MNIWTHLKAEIIYFLSFPERNDHKEDFKINNQCFNASNWEQLLETSTLRWWLPSPLIRMCVMCLYINSYTYCWCFSRNQPICIPLQAVPILCFLVFCFLFSLMLMAEILDTAATWTGQPQTHANVATKGENQSFTKSKVDESRSVWVQEARHFILYWFDWLWKTPQPQCLWTLAVTDLLQTRHPVSHGWWAQWQAYLEWWDKQLSCPEAS